jgi:hypothetical protein
MRGILPMMQTQKICFVLSLFLLFLPAARAQSSSSDVAPAVNGLPAGVALPQSGTVFALDRAHPELVQLHPSEVVSNSHAAGNFARSMVYVGGHASIELKGLNSSVHLADGSTSFYIRVSGDDPELMRERVHLIRLDQTKDRRVVTSYSQNIFGGQRKKKFDDIPLTKSNAEKSIWLKITPQKPLAPGEYGIVFMSNDPSFVPDAVYDFDVAIDSAAPDKS